MDTSNKNLHKIKAGDGVHYYNELPYVTSSVGQVTQEGGEIFNDYETNKALNTASHTEGTNGVSSCMGFKLRELFLSLDGSGEKEVLTFTIEGDATALLDEIIVTNRNAYNLENSISIQWGNNYDLCCNVVQAIYHENDNITTGKCDKGLTNLPSASSGWLWVPTNPEIGNVQLGTAAHAEGCATKAVQAASHSEGYNTLAAGKYAHAEGHSTIAVYAAHAEGYNNKALGQGSHAEGRDTTASGPNSHTEGVTTIAKGRYSHAEGSYTEASQDGAHAEGYSSKAEGENSHTEGQNTKALGRASHAEGASDSVAPNNLTSNDTILSAWETTRFNLAKGIASHTEGNNTLALGNYSHAEGALSKATGVESHAEGTGTKASGIRAHAEGHYTEASGESSHSEGVSSQSIGRGSHAEGRMTQSQGTFSHSEGNDTRAIGQSSHAEGERTKAQADYSHSSGWYTRATAQAQHSVGKYNEINDDALFIVGNGTADNARSNAFTVYEKGYAEVQTMGETDNSVVTKKYVDDGLNTLVISNTISGEQSLTVNDVSPFAHKCSLKLTSEDGNIYKLNNENFKLESPPTTFNYEIKENGILVLNGHTKSESISALFYLKNLTIGEQYTFSILDVDSNFTAPNYVFYLEENGSVGEEIENTTINNNCATFTPAKSTDCVAILSVGAAAEEPLVNEILYPQLVLGGSPVEKNFDFTRVKVNVNDKYYYTPNADGTVTNIESISPTMEITTDNEHVNICDFTYCVDTKKYVDSNATSADFIIVTNELPETGESNKLYLVPKADSQEQDLFDEFIWVNNTWEWITTKQIEVDLTDYVKNTDYATKDKAGVIKINSIHGVSIYNGELMIERANASEIAAKKLDRNPITPAYLDIAVKTGVTTNTIPLTEEEKASACEWLGVDGLVGDIDEALDEIIEIQESLKDGYTGGTGGVSSWNDLTDKPFYDEGTKTATLDYANPPTVGIDFNGVFLGKVTDDILTADYINGAKLSLSFTVDDTVTDVSQELNTDTLMGFSFPFGSAYQFTDENITCMIAVATQSGEFDPLGDGNLINIPETGTYIDCSFISGEGTINSISLEYAGELKTLDIKFIPNDLYTKIDQRIENYINEALGGEY